MGRPKKSVPAPIEPEEESQVVPDEEPAAVASGKAISGAEAVRQAMADGLDRPGDIADFVSKRFGLSLSKPLVSSYKSQEKARQARKRGRTKASEPANRPRPKAPLVEGYLAPPPRPAANGETDLLDAMEAMKALVANLGVEKVKRIAELLG
jgi:hypothetical protein